MIIIIVISFVDLQCPNPHRSLREEILNSGIQHQQLDVFHKWSIFSKPSYLLSVFHRRMLIFSTQAPDQQSLYPLYLGPTGPTRLWTAVNMPRKREEQTPEAYERWRELAGQSRAYRKICMDVFDVISKNPSTQQGQVPLLHELWCTYCWSRDGPSYSMSNKERREVLNSVKGKLKLKVSDIQIEITVH
jgi:hypothetical protein